MAVRQFPSIQPSGRSYTPGKIAETEFQALNGATVYVQLGTFFVNATLSLQFQNIDDSKASEILQHYESVIGDDYVTFSEDAGFGGISNSLRNKMQDGNGRIKWRYDGQPEFKSVYPGITTVSCSFIGYLSGV